MPEVVAYSSRWPEAFADLAIVLREALAELPDATIEHVGSTSVPGLAAKPVLDVDIVVESTDVGAAITALEAIGYRRRGDLGVVGREAFTAPADGLARHVYVCVRNGLAVRNHLGVRDVLRQREDLRDEYAAVKLSLATDPSITMDDYIAGKSDVLQRVLRAASLTDDERRQILALNEPAR